MRPRSPLLEARGLRYEMTIISGAIYRFVVLTMARQTLGHRPAERPELVVPLH